MSEVGDALDMQKFYSTNEFDVITAHIRSIMRRLCFQRFCPSVHRAEEGGPYFQFCPPDVPPGGRGGGVPTLSTLL